MVAIPAPRASLRQTRRLADALQKASSDLGELRTEAQRLLADGRERAKLGYWGPALQVLTGIVEQGERAIAERIATLGSLLPATALGETARGPLITWTGASRFLSAYRRCGRRLCLALEEARTARDFPTADVLFHLLHDLERQLWLVESRRGSQPSGGNVGSLLPAC